MPTGRLGANSLSATTETTVYQVPTAKYAVLAVTLVNRDPSVAATVRIALANAATATNAEYIEYGASIPAGGVLERTGIVLDAGKYLNVYSSTSNVNAVAYGFETSV